MSSRDYPTTEGWRGGKDACICAARRSPCPPPENYMRQGSVRAGRSSCSPHDHWCDYPFHASPPPSSNGSLLKIVHGINTECSIHAQCNIVMVRPMSLRTFLQPPPPSFLVAQEFVMTLPEPFRLESWAPAGAVTDYRHLQDTAIKSPASVIRGIPQMEEFVLTGTKTDAASLHKNLLGWSNESKLVARALRRTTPVYTEQKTTPAKVKTRKKQRLLERQCSKKHLNLKPHVRELGSVARMITV